MNLQYISDETGKKTAVVIPIKDWEKITKKYTDLNNFSEGIIDKEMSKEEFKNWIEEAEATESLTYDEYKDLWKTKEKELQNLM